MHRTQPARDWAAVDTAARRARLSRMKWFAGALLAAVAVLYLAATLLGARHPGWTVLPYVASFAEAAMVGALADWFAVVALFRHPLGMRFIPHTAIIPRNKQRIAENLGEFVQGEFFSTARLVAAIRTLDPAARLARWLASPAGAARVGSLSLKALAYALHALDEQQVRHYLRAAAADGLRRLDLARLAGTVLDALTHDARHQALLDEMLRRAAAFLGEPAVRERIIALFADKLPLYFEFLKQKGADLVAARVLDYVGQILAEVDGDPHHPLRADFDAALREMIEKLKADPAMRLRVEQFKDHLLAGEALPAYLDEVWHGLRAWLQRDLDDVDSALHAKVIAVSRRCGALLRRDRAMRGWLNQQLIELAPPVVDRYRPMIGAFIADKMKEWNDREMVDKLELNIGPDLQFIRVNGTVVGGLVGVLIHAATVYLT